MGKTECPIRIGFAHRNVITSIGTGTYNTGVQFSLQGSGAAPAPSQLAPAPSPACKMPFSKAQDTLHLFHRQRGLILPCVAVDLSMFSFAHFLCSISNIELRCTRGELSGLEGLELKIEATVHDPSADALQLLPSALGKDLCRPPLAHSVTSNASLRGGLHRNSRRLVHS